MGWHKRERSEMDKIKPAELFITRTLEFVYILFLFSSSLFILFCLQSKIFIPLYGFLKADYQFVLKCGLYCCTIFYKGMPRSVSSMLVTCLRKKGSRLDYKYETKLKLKSNDAFPTEFTGCFQFQNQVLRVLLSGSNCHLKLEF